MWQVVGCNRVNVSCDISMGSDSSSADSHDCGSAFDYKNFLINRCSYAWMGAIHSATECVRSFSSPAGKISLQEIESSLIYFCELEKVLMKTPQFKWKDPPKVDPPRFFDFKQGRAELCSYKSSPPPLARLKKKTIDASKNSACINPFEVFLDVDEETEDSVEDGEDEGGDQIVMQYPKPQYLPSSAGSGGSSSRMDVVRLIIRIMAAQSDLEACKASILVKKHRQWSEGAVCLAKAIGHVRKALATADAEISKWQKQWQSGQQSAIKSSKNVSYSQWKQRQQDLMHDADIVQVALQYLVVQQNRYLLSARRQLHKLRLRWNVEQENREQARRRMGTRWINNSSPKYDHIKRRRSFREQLRQVEEVLKLFQSLALDTSLLQAKLHSLKIQLSASTNEATITTTKSNTNTSSTTTRKLNPWFQGPPLSIY